MFRRRAGAIGVLLALVLVSVYLATRPSPPGTPIGTGGSTVPTTEATVPPNDPERAMVYDGLRPGRAGGPCEGMYELESLPDMCTHGPDPLPEPLPD